jgi:hypothetical protein
MDSEEGWLKGEDNKEAILRAFLLFIKMHLVLN